MARHTNNRLFSRKHAALTDGRLDLINIAVNLEFSEDYEIESLHAELE